MHHVGLYRGANETRKGVNQGPEDLRSFTSDNGQDPDCLASALHFGDDPSIGERQQDFLFGCQFF